MKARRGFIAGAVTAGLALTMGMGTATAANPNTQQKMARAITTEAVVAHLEALEEIAQANNGTRAAGTSGYEATAQYIETVLRGAGYDPQRQYFSFDYFDLLEASLTEVSPTPGGVEHVVMSYSPSTPAGGVTGELAAPEVVTGCAPEDYAGADLSGQIALVSRGGCTFAAKSAAAGSVGAEAIIIYNNVEGTLNGTLGGIDSAQIPTTGITDAEGARLVAELAAGPVVMTFDAQTFSETRETFNILAETDSGRADNVVMLGAHLDSVDSGPGINDNGSGSSAILETAVQLSKVNKLNNKVRFAWWGAEEFGLLGSWHYIEDLDANNPDEFENIATYLNFDMVGSPNYIIGVYDADQSTYPAPVTVPEGSVQTEQVFTDWFDSQGQAWVDTEFSGRSDYQGFLAAGIPASGLFTGADDVKTDEQVALFGGTAGITHDPNYHTPGDDLSNVNRTALGIMSDAIGAAAISLAQDTSAINGKRSAGKSGNPHPRGDILMEGVQQAAA
ncbi:MAG: M28 family peptidase [Actinomycetales bacterium]